MWNIEDVSFFNILLLFAHTHKIILQMQAPIQNNVTKQTFTIFKKNVSL